MRNNRVNYFVAGLFVILMVVSFIVSVAVLSGRSGEVDNYYAWYGNVTGIKYGSQVVYEGYPIGQVEKISPVVRAGKMSFRIDFTVIKDWKIPNDSIAEIASPGILAAVVLNIQAGSSTAAYTPGGGVSSKEQSNVFGAMTSLAEELTVVIEEDVKPLISNIDAAVQVINEFIGDDAAALLQDFSKRIPSIATNIEEFSISINETSKEINRVTKEAGLVIKEVRLLVRPENRKMIEDIIHNLEASTQDLNKSIAAMELVLKNVDALVVGPKPDVDAIVDEVRFITETVSRHIDSINRNLDASSRNMNEFSRQIRSNPGILLNGTPPIDSETLQ